MVDRFSASRFWQQAREYGATHIHFLGGILQILLKQPLGAARSRSRRAYRLGRRLPGRYLAPVPGAFRRRDPRMLRHDRGVEHHHLQRCRPCRLGRPTGAVVLGRAAGRRRGGSAARRARRDRGRARACPVRIFRGYFRNPRRPRRPCATARSIRAISARFDNAGNLIFHRPDDGQRALQGRERLGLGGRAGRRRASGGRGLRDDRRRRGGRRAGHQAVREAETKARRSTSRRLSAWIGERLAPYQNPRYIAVVDEFERTPSQRIMKHKLSKAPGNCWDRLDPK